jgi:protoporphyrin/coproporphyrin ferrochelatase
MYEEGITGDRPGIGVGRGEIELERPARVDGQVLERPARHPDPHRSGARAAEQPADHPPVPAARIGVLLLNLGTPDATGYWPMRRYLKEFLSDRRVIDVNPLIWKPLLNFVILTSRPFRSGRAYRTIWNKERDESPLRTITRSQCERLAAVLRRELPGEELLVDWAMRYGNPSTSSVLRGMVEAGCTRMLLLALYPQYAAATTATAYDEAFRALMEERWQPAIRTAPPYHDHPAYIEALARSIETHLAGLEWTPEVVLASFHGLPKRYLLLGDPYHCQCMKTARLLRERLGWSEDRLRVTFQSRFGNEEWLQPYTDEAIERLAREGVRSLAIVAPGFAADCLETLEELAIRGREQFLEHGGESFTFVPCLNDADDHVALLGDIVRRELCGWTAG